MPGTTPIFKGAAVAVLLSKVAVETRLSAVSFFKIFEIVINQNPDKRERLVAWNTGHIEAYVCLAKTYLLARLEPCGASVLHPCSRAKTRFFRWLHKAP
jgi:hypothetical protein